jgi:hypothetical protein
MVIAVVSVTSGLGVVAVTEAQRAASNTKIEADVRDLNQAVQIYQTGGGSLDDVETAPEVLQKLQTITTTEDGNKNEIMFLTGSMMDRRLKPLAQTSKLSRWLSRSNHHVRYNPEIQRFELTDQVAEDTFDGLEVDDSRGTSRDLVERRRRTWRQAKRDPWVWDFDPTAVNSTDSPPPEVALESPSSSPLTAPGRVPKALPPVASPAPPQLELTSYPLPVTLINPNPPGVTRILYQVAGGADQHFFSPFIIDPATTIRAWVQTLDETIITDSDPATFTFTPNPVQIALADTFRPTYTYFELGGPLAPGSPAPAPAMVPSVSMTNAANVPSAYQNASIFRVFYTTDVSDPVTSPTHTAGVAFSNGYPGDPIPLSIGNFDASGQVVIRYAAVSTHPEIVLTSAAATRSIAPRKIRLRAPTMTPTGGEIPDVIHVELQLDVSGADVPAGARIFYRTDGVDPGDINGEPEFAATLYVGPFDVVPTPGQTTTIVARVYPPTNAKRWFDTSPSISTSYTGAGPVFAYYGVNRTKSIYTVNPLTGETSVLDATAPYNLESIALDPASSVLYYLEAVDDNSRLGKFNLKTKVHTDLGRLVDLGGFSYKIDKLPYNLECWKGDLYCIPTTKDDVVKISIGTSGITDIRKIGAIGGNGGKTAFGSAMGYDGTLYYSISNALRKFHLPTLSPMTTIRGSLAQYNSLLFHAEQSSLFGNGATTPGRIDSLSISDGTPTIGPLTFPTVISFSELAEPSGVKPLSVPVAPAVYACTGTNREIYRVNPLDGTNSLFDNTAPFNVAALAYDDVEGVLFYIEQAAVGLAWRLGKVNSSATHTILGSIKTGWTYNPAIRPDNLAAYGGSLYYITPGTDDLVRIELTTGATTIAQQTKVADVTGGTKTFGNPGDLVIDADGMVFWINQGAAESRLYRYSLTISGGAYLDIGPTAAGYPALAFHEGSLYGARVSTSQVDRLVINTGNAESFVATVPAKTFVDFASPVPSDFAHPSDSLWAIREVGGRARLLQFVNYRNLSNNVQAVDWGEILHEDGASTPKSFSASGATTGISGMALSDDGRCYFVSNRAVTAGGVTFGRPLMSVSISEILKGNALVARVLGDMKGQIQTILGGSLPAATDRITGLAISPADDELYAVLNRTTGSTKDHLLRIDTFLTDTGEELGSVTNVGIMTGAGENCEETEDMTFDRNGILYVSDTKDDRVCIVNTATGAVTSLFSTQSNSNYAGLAIHPFDNELVGSSTDDSLLDQMMHVTAGSGNDPTYFNYRTRFGYTGIQAMAFYTYPKDTIDSPDDPSLPPPPPDPGLAGGHMDVDTSSHLYPLSKGSTDGHIHQYDDKFNVTGANFFAFETSTLHNINRDIVSGWTKFKIIVSNPALSPGGRIVINKTYNPDDPTTYTPVETYANIAIGSLPIYSLEGIPGTIKLEKFGMYFPVDTILLGGLIPTVTGAVRSNTPGKFGEWRNGALTVQAVLINPDGSAGFTTDLTLSNGGRHGVARSGLLWESTMFNHHHGPSYDRQ